MTNWISISDRLPLPYDFVLTYGEEGVQIARRYEHYGEWFWYVSTDMSNDNVTHWMPLPEPPKA